MRPLYLDSSGLTLRRDYSEPFVRPGESLVRVTTAGMCGTDLELAQGYMGYKSGRFDPRPSISARFPLDDAIAAFDAAAQSSNFKCLLQIA